MELNLITSAAMVGALALASAPAFADDQHDRGHRSPPVQQAQVDRGHAVERQRADAPRAEAPRALPPRAVEAPRAESRVMETPRAQQPRVMEPPQAQAPRAIETPRPESRRDGNNRRYDGRQNDNRQYDNRRAADGRRDLGHAVPRDERSTIVSPRYYDVSPRYYDVSPQYYDVSPQYYEPRVYYRPYVFRPRTRIDFGIFLGYPVPYTYAYPYPVAVYGYGGPVAPVVVGPGSRYYGGVSLEISPGDAEVFVDGEYAGVVQDFDGTERPLTLTAGSHRLDVRAPGYGPLAMDVYVNPGEVVPCRGDLLPDRY